MAKLVGVGAKSYKEEKVLKNLTYKDFKLIISDDCSTKEEVKEVIETKIAESEAKVEELTKANEELTNEKVELTAKVEELTKEVELLKTEKKTK